MARLACRLEGPRWHGHRHRDAYRRGSHEMLISNLAAGNTLTRHETLPFGDLTPYLSANLNQDLGGGKNFTDFSLTPGIRFFLGWHTYFITGVIVPVTNPKPFEPGLTAVVSRGW